MHNNQVQQFPDFPDPRDNGFEAWTNESWLDVCGSDNQGIFRLMEPVFVTPSLAAAILERNTHNRPMTEKQVLQHMARIRDGYFVATPDAAAFDTDGTLIEGQHRLTAIVRGGLGAFMNFDFGYPPSTFHALGEGKPRTVADHQGIAGAEFPKDRGSAAKVLMQLDSLPHGDRQAVGRYIDGLDQTIFAHAITFAQDMKNSGACGSASGMAAAYYFAYVRSATVARWDNFIMEVLGHIDTSTSVNSLLTWLGNKAATDTREGISKNIERVKMFTAAWVRFNAGGRFSDAAVGAGLGEIQASLDTLAYPRKPKLAEVA